MAKKAVQSKKTVKEKKSSGKKADIAVLLRPRITEKSAHASAASVYVFDVANDVTKSEIAKAFEMLYKHVPIKVRTLVKKPKSYFKRTVRGGQLGFAKRVKKAYVYLPKGVTVDVM